MELLLLLSLHLFLIVCYYICIEIHKSRLNHGYLLFALFFPFVGELCLLVAELGNAPAEHEFVKPFKQFTTKEDASNQVVVDLPQENEITRGYLLSMLKKPPQNMSAILKIAMNSADSEIVHIAAASIMKRQREYEQEMRDASEACKRMPNSMSKLRNYIMVIDAYYAEELLGGAAATSLLEQQEILLNMYLRRIPNDIPMSICLIQNYLQQKKFAIAIERAEELHYSNITDAELCGLLLETYYQANELDMAYALLKNTEKISIHWSSKDQKYWERKQRGFGLCVAVAN